VCDWALARCHVAELKAAYRTGRKETARDSDGSVRPARDDWESMSDHRQAAVVVRQQRTSIIRENGSWPEVLIAAGLVPAVHPSAYQPRSNTRRAISSLLFGQVRALP
jgi:hypothetical protein